MYIECRVVTNSQGDPIATDTRNKSKVRTVEGIKTNSEVMEDKQDLQRKRVIRWRNNPIGTGSWSVLEHFRQERTYTFHKERIGSVADITFVSSVSMNTYVRDRKLLGDTDVDPAQLNNG